MSTPVPTTPLPAAPALPLDPTHFRDQWEIQLRDASGKVHSYYLRFYDENNQQCSLSIEAWQKEEDLIQRMLESTLKQTSLPSSFNVNFEKDKISFQTDTIFRDLFLTNPDARRYCFTQFQEHLRGNVHFATDKRFLPVLMQRPPAMDSRTVDEMMEDFDLTRTMAPLPIINETGTDCFIISFLQAFVLNNRELVRRFLEDAKKDGETAEIGYFIYNYLQAQKAVRGGQPATPVAGIRHARRGLDRANGKKVFETGQHDPTEAFAFLFGEKDSRFPAKRSIRFWTPTDKTTPVNDAFLAKFNESRGVDGEIEGGKIKTTVKETFDGYLAVDYQSNTSLQTLVDDTLKTNPNISTELSDGTKVECTEMKTEWDGPPAPHFLIHVKPMKGTLENAHIQPLGGVPNELTINGRQYRLDSYIQHRGPSGNSGHYVAYTSRPDPAKASEFVHSECNDETISPVQNNFARPAESQRNPAYILRYVLV